MRTLPIDQSRHTRLRRWPSVLFLVLGTAACGGGSTGSGSAPAPPSTIAPASAPALAAVRAAAEKTLSQSAEVSLDFAGLSSAPLLGQGSFDFARAVGSARIQQLAGAERVVFRPTVVFDQPPPPDAVGLPRGRTWIAAEPSEHYAAATNFAQFVLQMQGKNPTFMLAELSWGVRSAAPLGRQLVGGTAVNGYEAMVDLGSAAASASGPAASAFASTIGDEEQMLGATTQESAPLQPIWVWVDNLGRVVRLRTSPPGSGVGTTTMTFSSFGVHADPPRPPRSQTVDVTSLLPGATDFDRD